MKNLELIIQDRTKAGKYLLSTSQKITHVVSIHDPTGKPAPGFFHHPAQKLRLVFDDIIIEDPGLTLPTQEHIHDILTFSEKIKNDLKNDDCKLLVHCFAGISRSSAAAFIILCSILGPGAEEQAIEEVIRVRKQAWPNSLMVHLADQIMDRKGMMTLALSRFNSF